MTVNFWSFCPNPPVLGLQACTSTPHLRALGLKARALYVIDRQALYQLCYFPQPQDPVFLK